MGRIVAMEMASVYGIWTVRSSLIRNLEKAFWFGTPRVIEEDRKAGNGNRELGSWNRVWELGIGEVPISGL